MDIASQVLTNSGSIYNSGGIKYVTDGWITHTEA